MSAPVRIEIIIHPGGVTFGEAFPLDRERLTSAEEAAHIASGLPPASPAALQAADAHDRAQLVAALEEAHRRDHELVADMKKVHDRNHQLEAQMREQNDLLRQRTIERDHFKEDSLLWSLIVAKFVDDEDGELVLDREEINAYMGKMLDANVRDGMLYIRLEERPDASAEGGRG